MAILKDLIVNGVSRFVGKVYGTFVGDLTGNADTSTKATQDESGNNIKTNYGASLAQGSSNNKVKLVSKSSASLGEVTINNVANADSATNATKLNNQEASYYLNYTNLSNKPTIPAAANNGKLTIQGNGTMASEFTANQSNSTTLNIKGDGATTVTKSANNEITISSTNTTYSSKTAVSGGSDISLVTTGEKYTWNAKETTSGAQTKANTAESNAKNYAYALTGVDIADTRSVTPTPSSYAGNRTTSEFKSASAIGLSSLATGTYTHLFTERAWSDISGGYVRQLAFDGSSNKVFVRYGNQSTNVWSAWDTLETEAGSQAKVTTHSNNTTLHISSAERTTWNNKVDKVSGKGLSTEDFTTTEKTKLGTINEYIHSRGENLLTNGTGLLGNNTNFSAFTFTGADSYYSAGCFTYTRGVEAVFTDEYMPVNPELPYRFSMYAKSALSRGRYYCFVATYDTDKQIIAANHHMYRPNTLTTLAQPLNNGDTVMYLTNAANWDNSGTAGVSTHLRSIILWNYKNSAGYQYAPLTYSRNSYDNAWNPGAINYTLNTITLRTPWAYGHVPAGTSLSNGSSGGTYKYQGMAGTQLPLTWTQYSEEISGVDYSGANASGKFTPGTAFVKLGWLMDYQYTDPKDTIYLANLSFGLAAPKASTSEEGVIKVGANLNISNGVLSGIVQESSSNQIPITGWSSSSDSYGKYKFVCSFALYGIGYTSVNYAAEVLKKVVPGDNVYIQAPCVIIKNSAANNITVYTDDDTWTGVLILTSGGKNENNYTLPVATSSTLGGVKSGTDITIDGSGNVSVNDDSHNHIIGNVDGLQAALNLKANSTHVGATGSAHGLATTSEAGFMSSSDKTKLNGISTGANNYSLPVATASTLGGIKSSASISISASGVATVVGGGATLLYVDESADLSSVPITLSDGIYIVNISPYDATIPIVESVILNVPYVPSVRFYAFDELDEGHEGFYSVVAQNGAISIQNYQGIPPIMIKSIFRITF